MKKRKAKHFGKEAKYNRIYVTKNGFYYIFDLVFKELKKYKKKGIYRKEAVMIVNQMFKDAREANERY